jgi:hypothetical protein
MGSGLSSRYTVFGANTFGATASVVIMNEFKVASSDRALVLLIAEERESLAAYALKADAALTGCTAAQ